MSRPVLTLAGVTLAVALALPTSPALAGATSGELDTAYGTGGSVTLTSPAGDLQETRMVRQGDRTVVASSRWTYDPVTSSSDAVVQLQRLDAAGRLDATFGDAGTALVRFAAGPAAVRGVVALPGGAVVVLASTGTGSFEEQQVGLARLLPDGRPDRSFGEGGTTTTDLRARHLSPAALLPLADGGVLVGLDQDGPGSDFALARYGRAGRLVASYGQAGIATVDLGASDSLTALAPAGGGKVVAVGSVAGSRAQSVGVVRLRPDGRLDRTFGRDGRVRFRPGGPFSLVRSVTAVGDGYVVTGSVGDGGSARGGFAARLGPRGWLLGTFGDHGVLSLDVPGLPDGVGAVAVLTDGTLALAQSAGDGPFTGSLHRVSAQTAAPVPGFGTDGTVDLGETVPHQLLPDGDGLLLSATAFIGAGPTEVVQRRR